MPLLAVTVCAGAGAARAQGVQVALFPSIQDVSPGADFDLEIRVTQSGSGFNGFDAHITFDPAALTLVPQTPIALQQGELMTAACDDMFHRFSAGASADTITDVLMCAETSLTGPGTLYKLRFHAASTPQVTWVRLPPGTLKFYNAGLYVTPVSSSDAVIGIGTPVTAVGAGQGAGRLALAASPNPSRGAVAFSASGRSSVAESLQVHDVQGRLVRTLALEAHHTVWDGRRESGEPAGTGIYFATLFAAGRATTIRFSLIR